MTFDEVIEKHRALRGAVQLRVTAGPDATPEGLDAALAEIWRKLDIYNAFSREEQLEAQLARMHGKLEAIDRMARRGDTGSIIAETDMVMAVDLEDDTDWMMAQRAKRGAALPEGLI